MVKFLARADILSDFINSLDTYFLFSISFMIRGMPVNLKDLESEK